MILKPLIEAPCWSQKSWALRGKAANDSNRSCVCKTRLYSLIALSCPSTLHTIAKIHHHFVRDEVPKPEQVRSTAKVFDVILIDLGVVPLRSHTSVPPGFARKIVGMA